MNLKRVFISGPMTGCPNYNKEEFDKAEKLLKDAGFSVFNPARLDLSGTDWSDRDISVIDLAALSRCDYIYQLSGWENSTGACSEFEAAKWMQIMRVDESWLTWYVSETKKKHLKGEDGVVYRRGDEKKKQDFLNGASSRKDLASI